MDPPRFSRTIAWLTLFAVAMAYLEATVVVYLRRLYYPEGFAFPLKLMLDEVARVEYLREISTLLMLGSVGLLAGRNFATSFAWFLYSFGLWDILYYVWLKVLLDWPASLLTWDILFLIPTVWVGPVLAPVICSITMILLAACILHFEMNGKSGQLRWKEWALLLSGAFVIVLTFIWDYSKLALEEGLGSAFASLGDSPLLQERISEYIPTEFHWYPFAFGEMLMLCAVGLFLRARLGSPASSRNTRTGIFD